MDLPRSKHITENKVPLFSLDFDSSRRTNERTRKRQREIESEGKQDKQVRAAAASCHSG